MSHKPAWLVEADKLAPTREFVVIVRPDEDDVSTEFHGRNRAQRRAVWAKASARQQVGGTSVTGTPEERRVDKAMKAEAAMAAGRRGRRITTVGDDGVTVVTYAPVKGAKNADAPDGTVDVPETPKAPRQTGRIRKALSTLRPAARPAA